MKEESFVAGGCTGVVKFVEVEARNAGETLGDRRAGAGSTGTGAGRALLISFVNIHSSGDRALVVTESKNKKKN